MSTHEKERAYNAHKSVKPGFTDTPFVLQKQDFEIVRKLARCLTPTTRETEGMNWQRASLYRFLRAHGKIAHYLTPPIDDLEIALRDEWRRGGHHELLMRMIRQGRVPLAWDEPSTPDHPPRLSRAMERARELGYAVPPHFIANAPDTSYSEREAFHAAHMLARGYFTFFTEGEQPEDYHEMRATLAQLSGQFIVPDPLTSDKTPYFLDQLWIFTFADGSIRLVAMEIDGEGHFTPEEVEKSRRRDAMLAAQGYEVFHVAGWWCRIDPYRAILATLAEAGLLNKAHERIIGARFKIIPDYHCEHCGEPMVRWDYDWIHELYFDDRNMIVHQCCADEAYEEHCQKGW